MNVLIFGGGGFIGSHIVDRLLLEDYSIRIFERPRVIPYRLFSKDDKVEWQTGDFSSMHDLITALDDIDFVIHLISTTLPKDSNNDPLYDVQSNVISTLQLLNAMKQKNVKKLIFISSGGTIYGLPEYLPIDENHPTNPIVSYGITKLTIEKYLLLYERMCGIKPIILRVSNPFGERQRIETAQGVLSAFIHKAVHDIPIEIWGDGSVTRDFLYIKDVAEAFLLAIKYNGNQRIFNISSGRGITLNELLELIENNVNKTIRKNYLPSRLFDVPINVLDNSLALKELKWSQQISIQDGIKNTIRWTQGNLG